MQCLNTLNWKLWFKHSIENTLIKYKFSFGPTIFSLLFELMYQTLMWRDIYLTLRGWFWTILTASSLLRCPQSPSDANIINWSWGCNWCTDIVGSALSIGFLKGSRRRNLAYKGSLLKDFFKYKSPIDPKSARWKVLEIMKEIKKGDATSQTSQHILTRNKILYSIIIL